MTRQRPFPPPPFLRKGVTRVQALRAFHFSWLVMPPPWGGPAETS